MDRRRFLTASALAAPLVTAAAAPAAADDPPHPHEPVIPGADDAAAAGWRALVGHEVAVVANHTATLRDGTHIVDSMVAAGVRPRAIFGPEHGFRGTAQAGGSTGDHPDPRTGIQVYDAYTLTEDELAEHFLYAGIDLVVFDIADVGARFYTYIWTMYTAMRAAARVDAAFLVLDRPNPIGGEASGPVLDPAFASPVGRLPIALRHGMTTGELAALFQAEFLPEQPAAEHLAELTVVPARGWRRDRFFADTGLGWILPSPNMPTADTALVYPGTGLFEGTLLSEGRGTTRPFEIIGAPGIDWHWAEALNDLGLPGVRFREHYFQPTFDKFTGQACGGVQVHVTDARRFAAVETAVAMIVALRRTHPAVFGWRPDDHVDRLFGSDRLRRQVSAGADTDEIVGGWAEELTRFRERRRPYLRYP